MLCIEFPSASPADVRWWISAVLHVPSSVNALHLRLQISLAQRKHSLIIPWDFDANYMTITIPFVPFFKSGISHIKLYLPVY